MIVIASREDYGASQKAYRGVLLRYPDAIFVGRPDELDKVLAKYLPEYVFFVFWSWKIPEDIISYFKCVSFHASDLPKFRGGSPIQNQIMAGLEETKITAFRTSNEMDAGDILLKKKLSLKPLDLLSIFETMSIIIPEMIWEIIEKKPVPKIQEGEPTYCKRRAPEQSEITLDMTAKYAFNLVRALNMRPYPPAFIRFSDGTRLNILYARMD